MTILLIKILVYEYSRNILSIFFKNICKKIDIFYDNNVEMFIILIKNNNKFISISMFHSLLMKENRVIDDNNKITFFYN